jgi:ParB-like chromosome segregation protein Spo0J
MLMVHYYFMEKGNPWQKQLMRDIIKGNPFQPIHLRDKDGVWEIVDGGHRTRTVYKF